MCCWQVPSKSYEGMYRKIISNKINWQNEYCNRDSTGGTTK